MTFFEDSGGAQTACSYGLAGLPALTPAMRLPDPAPLPSLTSALSRRAAIFGAVVAATVPASAEGFPRGFDQTANLRLEQNDAELIALGREWQASADRCARADKALDEAALRTREIDPPEALFLRPTDGWHFRCLAKSYRDDRGRWFWPGAVEKLRAYEFVNPWGDPLVRDRARRDEIVAAHDAWQAEIAAMEAAAGFTAADAESEAAHEENRVLRRDILTTEADTMPGIMVKVHVARWCWNSAVDMREHVADEAKAGITSGEAMSFSLAADLVAMLEREAA